MRYYFLLMLQLEKKFHSHWTYCMKGRSRDGGVVHFSLGITFL